LPETYVIFITERDIFEAGKALYHIRRKIEELECASFGDESHIIYVNGARRDNTPLGKLMQDFFEPDAEKIHYK
ncbi:MAG: hypothetical protein IJ934_06665, partial [Acetobacter sp.]|nr:hypothetical protein [Acetobacter sp.]